MACSAYLAHGPGHQSRTYCEVEGPHDVHRCVYGSFLQDAEWRDGDHPDNIGMTGFFDEPPQVDE